MNLTQNNKSHTAITTTSRKFEECKCPNCGTPHILETTQWTAYNLDGTPQGDLEHYLARYAICNNCGCIYQNDQSIYPDLNDIVKSPKYQAMLTQNLSLAEKKLHLMLLFPYEFARIEGLIACYYDDSSKREEALRTAIQAGIHESEMGLSSTRIIPTDFIPQLPLGPELWLTQRLYLIDLYRRAGEFRKAKALIKKEEAEKYHRNDYTTRQYIAKEKQLMALKNKKLT